MNKAITIEELLEFQKDMNDEKLVIRKTSIDVNPYDAPVINDIVNTSKSNSATKSEKNKRRYK